jgi:hypothetical protein
MDVIIESSQGMCPDSQHFCLKQTDMLKVLGTRPRLVAFEPKQIDGCRLLVSLAEPVSLDTAVRIDHDGAFLLGEVTGCWETPAGTVLAVVELSHYHPLGDDHAYSY